MKNIDYVSAARELRKGYKKKSFKCVTVDLLTDNFSKAYDVSRELFGYVDMELSDLNEKSNVTATLKSSLVFDETYKLKIMTK